MLPATVNRCPRCQLDDLEHARAHSAAGQLLGRLLELEFLIERFSIPWSDVSAEEVNGLRALKEERDRCVREAQENDRDRIAAKPAPPAVRPDGNT
ncbi:MAG TPA: hypothetical protein VN841_29180 [Bryobacteraceae bacterium]|nr:hypothetical protein [Bryobacteraceae bacterium]